MDVYFDDFSLTLAGGPIVQVDDFYPYGMIFNHKATDNAVLNRYLYQGKEKVSDDTDRYDFHARLYSPALGRFLGVDPQGQFINPYNGMGNNPVMYVDPDGEIAFLAVVGIVAAVSGGINFGVAAYQGKVDSFGDGVYYFGVGAAVGAGAIVGGAALAPVIGTGAIAGGIMGSASGFTLSLMIAVTFS